MIRVSYGAWYDDVREGLYQMAHRDYPIHETRLSTCWCGSNAFWIETDVGAGAVHRVCLCGLDVPLVDSAEKTGAAPTVWGCECGGESANVGAGFSCRSGGSTIEWVYVATRCAECGAVEPAANWKLGYEPSGYLMEKT